MIEFNNRTVNELKGIEESLPERYSSNQLFNVLDSLLTRGLSAVVENSNFVDRIAVSCMSWYSGNSRRKISQLPKPQVITLLSMYVIVESPRKKMKLLEKLRLERNIRFFILETFMEYSAEYAALEYETARLPISKQMANRERMLSIQRALGVKGNVTAIHQQVEMWYEQAIKFRNQIMEKYSRHAVMRARMFYNTDPDRLELGEVAQNFQLAMHKAINKFDPNKGTLTPYINQWLMNAQSPSSGFSHEYGVAYTIPAAQKRSHAQGTSKQPVNIAVSLSNQDDDESVKQIACSSLNPYEALEQESEVSHVRRLAKLADPSGLARIALGIEEHLSSQELKLLQTAAI